LGHHSLGIIHSGTTSSAPNLIIIRKYFIRSKKNLDDATEPEKTAKYLKEKSFWNMANSTKIHLSIDFVGKKVSLYTYQGN
jgi:hypothetical protein